MSAWNDEATTSPSGECGVISERICFLCFAYLSSVERRRDLNTKTSHSSTLEAEWEVRLDRDAEEAEDNGRVNINMN